MSFLNASTSFTRFKIVDPVPSTLWHIVQERLRQFAFHDIDGIPEERAFGWVCFDDMLDNEWIAAPPNKGPFLVFSLRLDTRRVPTAVLKKHIMVALRDEEARNKEQGINFISRERKKEIREQVKMQLFARFLPVPSEFNVAWDKEKGFVYLASTQPKICDMFKELFTRTFDLHIEPMYPSLVAVEAIGEENAYKLDTLCLTTFI